ncbi:MAG: HDIG domain-containing protein [Paludibacteraceae bacterium]|nr:HDIG domain-containing protein [Paludibacteraceae bacterium]
MNPYEIIEKYYIPGSDLYNILVKHSEAVRDKALALARRHPELGLDLEFIAEAAMLHDIGILETDAPGIKCFGTHRYIEHGYLGAEMMRREGLHRHALVCERHTGTGLRLADIIARDLPVPHRELSPVTLEEQLICYADKFFSKTRLDTEDSYERVEKKMQKWGEESVKQLRHWREIFE